MCFNSLSLLTISCLVLVYPDGNNGPSRYQISGITYLPGAIRNNKYIIIPKNSEMACIGAPEPMTSQFIRATPIGHPLDPSRATVRRGDVEGYTIHSGCWTLIQKRGIKRLDVLIRILRRRWEELVPYLVGDLSISKVGSQKDGESNSGNGEDVASDYNRLLLKRGSHGMYNWPVSDPVHIYELRTTLKRAYESRREWKTIRRSCRRLNLLSNKHRLPLEIMYLITEYLDISEIRDMVLDLNEQFPVSFWRRPISNLLFEVENIGANSINWPLLAFLVRRDFVLTSEGVLNRRRLLDMIRPHPEDEDLTRLKN